MPWSVGRSVSSPNEFVELTEEVFPSWETALEALHRLPRGWLFRGQTDASWELTTRLGRLLGRREFAPFQRHLVETFERGVHLWLDVGEEPRNFVELLALMQHHGAPTKLLDFTRSPYVAAFFAVERSAPEGADNPHCAIWAVEEQPLRTAARAELKSRYKDTLYVPPPKRPGEVEERFLESSIDARMLVVVDPTRTNRRLASQQGVFVAFGEPTYTFFENLASMKPAKPIKMAKLVFPLGANGVALSDLQTMNVTAVSLFPGLDGFARYAEHSIMRAVQERGSPIRRV
jgi:hypothetical protein